jgi:predicted  nucleic acid-binding Zn ribbon protein
MQSMQSMKWQTAWEVCRSVQLNTAIDHHNPVGIDRETIIISNY